MLFHSTKHRLCRFHKALLFVKGFSAHSCFPMMEKLLMRTDGTCMNLSPHVFSLCFSPFFLSFPPSPAVTSPLLRIKVVGVCRVRGWTVQNTHRVISVLQMNALPPTWMCFSVSCYCPDARLPCAEMISIHDGRFPHLFWVSLLLWVCFCLDWSSGAARSLIGKQKEVWGKEDCNLCYLAYSSQWYLHKYVNIPSLRYDISF